MENISLQNAVPDPEQKVCIFGQGFVGLPLSLSYAINGYQAIGVDVNEALVQRLNDSVTELQEEYQGQSIQGILAAQLQQCRYRATTDAAAAVKESRNIIVTVGIPIVKQKPMLLHLQTACQVIGRNLKPGDLVLIRSTVVPGTTEELVLPILESESGMRAGRDFYLAYSPERIAETRAFEEIAQMPTLVAGVNLESAFKARELLSVVCREKIITGSSIRVVETAKVLENLQRDANIAISQEMARFTEAMGVDIFETIRLANTHKRVNLMVPGPGVGGYCIPNAYHYLAIKADQLGVKLDILQLCRTKNAMLPEFIVGQLERMLQQKAKELSQSKIAVLGLAMKDYSNDDRISPPVEVCEILARHNVLVKAYDPVVHTRYSFKVDTLEEALGGADAVLILARQQSYDTLDCGWMVRLMGPDPVCLDTRALFSRDSAEQHQMLYWRI